VVSMTAPASGASVSGTVSASASASDTSPILGVQFLLDGANLGVEVTSSPYVLAWNTTTATNGSHSLAARARDAAGNTADATSVNVTLNNPTPPPSVSSADAGQEATGGLPASTMRHCLWRPEFRSAPSEHILTEYGASETSAAVRHG
jgi:hypothetical protein